LGNLPDQQHIRLKTEQSGAVLQNGEMDKSRILVHPILKIFLESATPRCKYSKAKAGAI